MFVDVSANRVGIGTTSPSADLHIYKQTDAKIIIEGDTDNDGGEESALLQFKTDGGIVAHTMGIEQGTANALVIDAGNGSNATVANNLVFKTKPIATTTTEERMRIDSTGNVGIGTDSPSEALTVSGNIQIEDSDGYLQFKDSNAGADNKLRRIYNAEQNLYISRRNDDGTIESNDVIIDSSGRVGIGTSSPLNKLDVEATQDTLANVLSNGSYAAKFSSTTSGDTGRTQGILLSAVNANTRGVALLAEAQGSNNAHNFVIATSAASSTPTERMRIDASGNLLVGRTSATAASGDNGIVLSPLGFIYSAKEGTSAQTHIGFINNTDATATTVGTIRTSGSTTSYNTSSDERLKENITDSADAGSKIDAIQIRQFDWKADGLHQDYGVIAQELVEVAPEAVSEGDIEEDMMGVDYSKLVPMLIKEVQSLRSRVAELENV